MVFNHSEAQGVPKQAQNIEICAERKIIFLYFLKCHTRFASIVDMKTQTQEPGRVTGLAVFSTRKWPKCSNRIKNQHG